MESDQDLESLTKGGRLSSRIVPWNSATDLATRWRALEANADCSFFQSWGWIGTLVECFGHRTSFYLFESQVDDSPIARALLGLGRIHRRRFFRLRIVALNEAVDSALNMCIEYDGILARRGWESEAREELFRALRASEFPWDELHVTNQTRTADLPKKHHWLRRVDDAEVQTWIATLSAETSRDAVLARLSRSRRWQIRRSLKEFEAEGPLSVRVTQTREEALAFFHRLGHFHTERWKRAGLDGTFSRGEWVQFHEALISNAFPRNEIQLLKISCGERETGYLYNLVWRGSVGMIQSGFAQQAGHHHRPGYVSHLLAIEYNAAQGAKEYDFLGGDSDYKRVLSDRSHTLETYSLQRELPSLRAEEALVKAHRHARRGVAAGIRLARAHVAKAFWVLVAYLVGWGIAPVIDDALELVF